jgi:hypothetical protein
MIEGKITNQSPIRTFRGTVKCARCNKLIPEPIAKSYTIILDNKESLSFNSKNVVSVDHKEHTFLTYHYIGTDYWTYESKLGFSVNYCSKYCRDKHNHRFNKKS